MGILFDMVMECNKTGKTPEQVDKEWNKKAKERVKKDPKNKIWGDCESCGTITALVREVSLCGPCCWGESATAYGNW